MCRQQRMLKLMCKTSVHRALIIHCVSPDTIHLHLYGQESVALLVCYNFQNCKYLKNKESLVHSGNGVVGKDTQ